MNKASGLPDFLRKGFGAHRATTSFGHTWKRRKEKGAAAWAADATWSFARIHLMGMASSPCKPYTRLANSAAPLARLNRQPRLVSCLSALRAACGLSQGLQDQCGKDGKEER